MICGKDEIIQYLDETKENADSIVISLSESESDAPPFDRERQIGRDSIDLRIGSSGYKIMCNYDYINTMASDIDRFFYDFTIPKDGYIIFPGETIIVSTVERVKLSGNIIGILTGRTRFARMGLSVSSAFKFQGFSDAVIVLQICNNNKVPLKIFPYQKLAQMIIYQVDGMPNELRGSYNNEVNLKKPIIDQEELSGFDDERKKYIDRQHPTQLEDISIDGNNDIKLRIKKNNKVMNIVSKVLNAISVILALFIGIYCSKDDFNTTYIIISATSATLLIIMATIIDSIKDNNTVE